MVSRSLNKKFDKILAREEAGNLTSKTGNRSLRKMMNNRLAIVGLILFSIILFTAVFAPLITSADPMKINLRNMSQPPSWEHWFGTDKTGRDVLARVLYGGRVSILVGLGSGIISAIIGVLIGAYTGYKGGWLDVIALRVSELFMSFPQIILVLLLVSIIGQSLINLMIIFVLTGWGGMYRMARARMLSLREEEFVQALQKLRSVNSSYLLQTYPAQCLGPDHGEHYAVDCSLYFGRGWPKLPGFRCACSHSDLGQYLKCRSGNPRFAELLVDVVTSRRGYFAFCSKC